jgi:DNA-directed RNA polymerase II subunit RPB1
MSVSSVPSSGSSSVSSSKRNLTEAEIQSICALLPLNPSIPSETAECVRDGLVKNLREQLTEVLIYPEGIPKLRKTIEEEYYRSLLQAGEMVGVQAATSIGEPVSQMTLNAFHYSGISTIGISSGVPRVEEILNASKKQKTRMMNLFMKEKKDLSEIRKEVYHSVTEVCLGSLLAKVEIDFIQRFEELDEEEQKWYRLYMDMYSSEIMEENQFMVQWRIRLHLNRDPLFHHSVSTLDVARKVENSFRDLHAVASPTSIGIVDVFVDFNGIKIKKKKEEEEDNAKEIKCIHNVVLPYLKDIMICGMEGVTDVYMHKEQGEWVIDTNGSNLYAAFANEVLDYTRCMSSDIWEIYRILGVEATRNFIIQEFYKVLASSGASVGRRHIELLADSMTYQGKINSVNRYGIDRDQIGPMAKASFEESVRNFFIAAVNGETDHMGVSASIMGGKMVRSGTGFVDLKLDADMIRSAPALPEFVYPEYKPEIKEKPENKPEYNMREIKEKPENKPEYKSEYKPAEYKPEYKSEYKPKEKSEYKPAEYKSEYKPAEYKPKEYKPRPVYQLAAVGGSLPGMRSEPVAEKDPPPIKQSFMKRAPKEVKKSEVLLDFEDE